MQSERIERLAEYLCSEFDFSLNPCVGYSWPEHENDDGYRGDGSFVKLQPSDVQAYARENAKRILAFLEREAALSAAEPVSFEGQNYNCPCVHPSQCDESCLKPAPSVAVKALADAYKAGFDASSQGYNGEVFPEYEADNEWLAQRDSDLSALSAQVQDVAVAEIVSAHGDPEAFGERELVALVDIQKFPYRTKLYAAAPAKQEGGHE